MTETLKETPIRSFIDKEKLKEDIAFSDENIQVAFMNQASLFVHYATKAHQARLQADRLKHRLDVLESRLDGEIRKEAAETSAKLTEGGIAARIKVDPRHMELKDSLLDAQTIADLCRDVLEAFRHRRDMLVQFGADVRQEREGELRLRAKSAGSTEKPSQRAERVAASVAR
jgi:hypothetical protein